jgi:hypothetical protein
MQLVSVQPINIVIEDLQQKIICEIAAKSGDLNLSAIVSVKALQDIADRLTKIHKILNIQRYNLIFIGQVGAGKTTAICHLFDLVRELEDTHLKGSNKVKIKKVKELLSTGAGKTTICEVVIRPSLQTSIEIDPYEVAELQQSIEDFGLWIWQKTHPAAIKERVEIPPDELLRAIRNIVGLPEIVANGKIWDRGLEFAASFTSDLYLEFKQALIDRGRLAERIETKICPTEIDLDERLWLSQIFKSLNVAQLPNFSIPKRIYLNLSQEFLDLSQYPRLGSIIDTRGLDLATKDRRDLAQYIRETDNSICIFTERFPAAPANTIQIIGKYLTATAKDVDTKFAMLVMPRKGEPEKVIGSDGQAVDDFAQGIELRKANINNVFQNEDINFLGENVFFYDALQCYLGDGSLDLNYEKSEIVLERERVFAEINRIIIDREQQLTQELSILTDRFQQIVSGNNLTEIEDAVVIDAAKKINIFNDLVVGSNLFSTNYVDMLPDHHCTLRATNNRYGQYGLRGIDIYFNGQDLAESLTRKSTQTAKIEISKIISFIETEISQDSTLHPLMQQLCNQIDRNYEAFAIEIGTKLERILIDRTFAPQNYEDCVFWQQTIDRWGQGSGYKVDVLSLYQEQVAPLDGIFADLIQTAWRDRLIQPILTFLGEAKPVNDRSKYLLLAPFS